MRRLAIIPHPVRSPPMRGGGGSPVRRTSSVGRNNAEHARGLECAPERDPLSFIWAVRQASDRRETTWGIPGTIAALSTLECGDEADLPFVGASGCLGPVAPGGGAPSTEGFHSVPARVA